MANTRNIVAGTNGVGAVRLVLSGTKNIPVLITVANAQLDAVNGKAAAADRHIATADGTLTLALSNLVPGSEVTLAAQAQDKPKERPKVPLSFQVVAAAKN